MAENPAGGSGGGGGGGGGGGRDTDNLPASNIDRIMRNALPRNAQIAKDVKPLVQEYTTEFIKHITSMANLKCKGESRRIVNGDDLLWALQMSGLNEYVDPLRTFLTRYRDREQ